MAWSETKREPPGAAATSSGPRPGSAVVPARAALIAHGAKIDAAELDEALGACGFDRQTIDVHLTSPSLDARTLSEQAAAAGVDRIVALGGDGTIHEVVGGLLGSGVAPLPALGVVPLGTANDLATSLEIPDELCAALMLALTGAPQAVDVGRIDGRPFVNVVTGGVMSEATAQLDPAIKDALGGLAYTLAGLVRLPKIEPLELRVTTADASWEGQALAIAIGNARMAGGGFDLCPDARIDDGALDLSIVPAELDAAALVELMLARSVADCEQVVRLRSDRVTLTGERTIHFSVDGEPLEARRVELGVAPRELGLCIPAQARLLGAKPR